MFRMIENPSIFSELGFFVFCTQKIRKFNLPISSLFFFAIMISSYKIYCEEARRCLGLVKKFG